MCLITSVNNIARKTDTLIIYGSNNASECKVFTLTYIFFVLTTSLTNTLYTIKCFDSAHVSRAISAGNKCFKTFTPHSVQYYIYIRKKLRSICMNRSTDNEQDSMYCSFMMFTFGFHSFDTDKYCRSITIILLLFFYYFQKRFSVRE